MEKVIINCYEDFQNYLGKEIGVSEYLTVDQARINLFADATLDHQWIHTDEERCRRESPFGQTIAHGYLTLSLLPYLWDEIIQVNNLERLVNYGLDRLKFGQPVLSGQAIRLRTELVELANLRGAIKMSMHFVIEIRETGKKAVEGVSTFVYYFKKQ
jgi:acyl dehydratase